MNRENCFGKLKSVVTTRSGRTAIILFFYFLFYAHAFAYGNVLRNGEANSYLLRSRSRRPFSPELATVNVERSPFHNRKKARLENRTLSAGAASGKRGKKKNEEKSNDYSASFSRNDSLFYYFILCLLNILLPRMSAHARDIIFKLLSAMYTRERD